MPFSRTNPFTPSLCLVMLSPFCRRYVSNFGIDCSCVHAPVMQLLTRDPARRLGSGKSDAEEIKRHPFFKDVSFDDVLNKRIPPPYFPTVVRSVIYFMWKLSDHSALVYRTVVRTQVTSTKSSRRSSQHSLLFMDSYQVAIRPNSMASHGYVSAFTVFSVL